MVRLDIEDWDRWPEVEKFADDNGIGIPEAIERLLAEGLDYLS